VSVRTAIIGMGVTGLSCLSYLAGRDDLIVLDTRIDPPNAAAARAGWPDVCYRFGPAAFETSFAGIARVVVSPGVSLDHELVQRAAAAGAAVLSDIDLFCAAATAPVFGITGTNGKSTVTALTGHLLGAIGRNPGVGGNLGEPALDLLARPHDCYVLELSSFQLERMAAHPLHAAALLNITDDHLDRHGTLAAYGAVKRRIFRQTRRAVANRQDLQTLPDVAVGELVTFGLDAPAAGHWGLRHHAGGPVLSRGDQPLMPMRDVPVAGLHNGLNVLAACALVAEVDIDLARLASAVETFCGLPHRCQKVVEIDGVGFVDDSKATNVGATLAALEGLGGPHRSLVLIAGGDGKGADFSPLAEPVRRYVKQLVLLGRDAPLLERALADAAPVVRVGDMTEAVAAAMAVAIPGDTVLLAPACASLDMYRNYAARGEAFAIAARGLVAAGGHR
jgi:UDP-N-acetylmuramoylalanine--D-glutamate ligase